MKVLWINRDGVAGVVDLEFIREDLRGNYYMGTHEGAHIRVYDDREQQ